MPALLIIRNNVISLQLNGDFLKWVNLIWNHCNYLLFNVFLCLIIFQGKINNELKLLYLLKTNHVIN